jgi:CTP synthase
METVKDSIYEVPLILEEAQLSSITARKLGLTREPVELSEWAQFVERLKNPSESVEIAVVGKYVELHDAYLSIKEALVHGAVHHGSQVQIRWVHSEDLEAGEVADVIGDVDGILLCPGFGDRGMEGKIAAVRYAREQQIPYLGDCLGLQMLVVEFARNVAGLPEANTTEADPDTPSPVISMLSEQRNVTDMGGTMRLGGYDCRLVPGTKAAIAYDAEVIRERHRHRYEVNNELLPRLEDAGLIVAGRTIDGELVEIVELRGHPWMVAAQFHPEFTSRPNRPSPLFRDFVGAALVYARSRRAPADAGVEVAPA